MTAIRGYKLNCVSKVNILFYSLLTQFNLHPRFVCYNRVRIIIAIYYLCHMRGNCAM